jgi:hypothetical protein
MAWFRAAGCDVEPKAFIVGWRGLLAEVEAVLARPGGGEPNVFVGVPKGVVEKAGPLFEGALNGEALGGLEVGFEVAAVFDRLGEPNVTAGDPTGVVEKGGG